MARTGVPVPTTWDPAGLRAVGFDGFIPLLGLRGGTVPSDPGIYVVLQAAASTTPAFLVDSPLAPYAVSDLAARWLDDAAVLYIGKANGASESARSRGRRRTTAADGPSGSFPAPRN